MRYLVLIIFLVFFCSSALGQNVHVLVNIWDGTEYTIVEDLYSHGELPNLSSLGPLHTLTSNTDCFNSLCMKTHTKSQHATMLTGCLADVHGVYSNGEFKYLLDGLTVMEIIKTTHPTTKIAFITGKEEHVGVLLFKYAVDEIDFYQTETIGAIQVTEKVRELIRKWNGEDFFIVAHYRTPDVVGHIAGVNSQRYKDAIKLNDDQLGRLLEVLPVGTKVYVLSDHGFGHPQPTTHGDAPDTFIVSTEQIGNGLYMKAVAKFFLNHFNLTPFCE